MRAANLKNTAQLPGLTRNSGQLPCVWQEGTNRARHAATLRYILCAHQNASQMQALFSMR